MENFQNNIFLADTHPFEMTYFQLHPITAGLGESLWESVAEWLGWEGDLNSWIGRIQGGWETQLEVRCHGCHVSYMMNVFVCIVVKKTQRSRGKYCRFFDLHLSWWWWWTWKTSSRPSGSVDGEKPSLGTPTRGSGTTWTTRRSRRESGSLTRLPLHWVNNIQDKNCIFVNFPFVF